MGAGREREGRAGVGGGGGGVRVVQSNTVCASFAWRGDNGGGEPMKLLPRVLPSFSCAVERRYHGRERGGQGADGRELLL